MRRIARLVLGVALLVLGAAALLQPTDESRSVAKLSDLRQRLDQVRVDGNHRP